MIRGHLDVIVTMLGFVAALMLLVSGLGMASGTSTSVIERTRELGVLRAIGATPATVFKILTVESLAVALSGCAVALLLANPLSERLEALFGTGIVEYPFDHRFSWEGLALCVVLVNASRFVRFGVTTSHPQGLVLLWKKSWASRSLS